MPKHLKVESLRGILGGDPSRRKLRVSQDDGVLQYMRYAQISAYEKLRRVPPAMFSRATKRQRLLVEALALCVEDLDVPKEHGLFLNLFAIAHDHDLHICRIQIFPRGCH